MSIEPVITFTVGMIRPDHSLKKQKILNVNLEVGSTYFLQFGIIIEVFLTFVVIHIIIFNI